jgi:hypothetical protein
LSDHLIIHPPDHVLGGSPSFLRILSNHLRSLGGIAAAFY